MTTPPNDQDWERLCRRCGRCCFEKWVDEDGTIHDTPIPCRYLDIVSRTCKVYHQRFSVGEGCIRLTPQVVANLEWLPDECGYIVHLGLTTSIPLRTGAPHAKVLPPSAAAAAARYASRRGRGRRKRLDP